MNSTSSAVTCHSNAAVVPPRSGSYPLCHVSRIVAKAQRPDLRGHGPTSGPKRDPPC